MISQAIDLLHERAEMAQLLRGAGDALRRDADTAPSAIYADHLHALAENQESAAAMVMLGSGSVPDEQDADPYARLKARFEVVGRLLGAGELLTALFVAAPRGAEGALEAQIENQTKVANLLLARPDVLQWLGAAEAQGSRLAPHDMRNLFLMRRQWTIAAGLPPDLLGEQARLHAAGEIFHQDSKKIPAWRAEDEEWYRHAFDIARAVGEAKRQAMPGQFASAYEALLDDYAPGMKEERIEREFARLERALPALTREAMARQAAGPAILDLPESDDAALARLGQTVADMICLDAGRRRVVLGPAHPMAAGTPGAYWIFARLYNKNFLDTAGEVVHEGHHAKYDLGRPGFQPVDDHLGMGMHESMSLLGEAHGCAGAHYFAWLAPQVQSILGRPDDLALSAENLQRRAERVKPSLIRLYADELTYPLHIILRWQLEKAVIDDGLDIAELPKEFDEGMQRLLGVTPGNAAEGVKQDTHWPSSLVGYFPSYLIGRMGAAQLYNAACRQHPEVEPEIARGNYRPLHEWLDKNIYRQASKMPFDALIEQATGEPLNADYYLDHLSRRYLGRPYSAQPENAAAPPSFTPN